MNRWVSTLIPGTPPSVNDVPLDAGNPRYRRVRNTWMRDVGFAMCETGNRLPTPLERVTAQAVLTFTTRRRRDEGNYRSHLEKWLGDLLQVTGRLTDDTPDRYQFDRVVIVHGRAESTLIVIDYERPRQMGSPHPTSTTLPTPDARAG